MRGKFGHEPAFAKLNLFLHVTGRRADGYHLVDSLIAFAAVGDHLSVMPADALSLRVTGPMADAVDCAAEDNLIMRAAAALADLAGQPAKGALCLEKHLPVAAGIGGGSSDAAAALRLLMQFWGVTPPPEKLHEIGIRLGADVPVCLSQTPARVSGIGTKIEPMHNMPAGLYALLVNPRKPLSTAAVFKSRSGAFGARAPSELKADTGVSDFVALLAECRNDLEPAARRLEPEVDQVLSALSEMPGILLARMSGSGPTCFGLFSDPVDASNAGRELSRIHPGWWAAAAPLLGADAQMPQAVGP